MHTKKIFSIIPMIMGMVFGLNSARAVSIYDNSISANNINMLNIESMSFAHRGESLSESLKTKKVYGKMTRLDEYGDDGTSLRNFPQYENSDYWIKDVWLEQKHVNNTADYGMGLKERIRFNTTTVGLDTKDIVLSNGTIGFGAYVGYINEHSSSFHSDGQTVGLFTRYNYKNFSIAGILNHGGIREDFEQFDLKNSWIDVALDTSFKIRIDETCYLEPGLYLGYDWVSADDFEIDGDNVSSYNFKFWNLAPSLRFVKNIYGNWYGAISGKYVNVHGGKSTIYVDNTPYHAIDVKDYGDIGATIEYDFEHTVFDITIKKQLGDYDGWAGNIGLKYMF